MTVFSLVGVPKLVLTSLPSPSYKGISIKALHVRVGRSCSSSRHMGKQVKRKAAGLYVSKYKAEHTWLCSNWKKYSLAAESQVAIHMLCTCQFVSVWTTPAPWANTLKIPNSWKLNLPANRRYCHVGIEIPVTRISYYEKLLLKYLT